MINTYWKLTVLRGVPVIVGEQQREPHLILQAGTDRVIGHGGCNRFTGGYRTDGARLTIGDVASTRMACFGRGFTDEAGFFRALSEAASWRVRGSQLELSDQAGTLLARFEARHL